MIIHYLVNSRLRKSIHPDTRRKECTSAMKKRKELGHIHGGDVETLCKCVVFTWVRTGLALRGPKAVVNNSLAVLGKMGVVMTPTVRQVLNVA